jgi:hypothetical protein
VPILALAEAGQIAPGRPQVRVAQRRLDLADLLPRVLKRPGALQGTRECVPQRVHLARAQALLAQVSNRPRREGVPSSAIARQAHPQRLLGRAPRLR